MKKDSFSIIAHRGYSGKYPENTLLAFKEAIRRGAEMIEFDIRLTKDNIPVVIHDSTVNRISKSRGKISSMTFEQAKTIKLGRNQKIPSLKETLSLTLKHADINIEIKQKGAAKYIIGEIDDYCRRTGSSRETISEKILVTSYLISEIKEIKNFDNNIRVGLVSSSLTSIRSASKKFDLYSATIPVWRTTKRMVDKLHARDIKALIYTVNDMPTLKKMISRGADGVFTNFIDIKDNL